METLAKLSVAVDKIDVEGDILEFISQACVGEGSGADFGQVRQILQICVWLYIFVYVCVYMCK